MNSGDIIGNIVVIVVLAVVIFVAVSLARAVRIVPQSQAYVVERLGRFQAVMQGGFHLLVPFVDRVAARTALRDLPSSARHHRRPGDGLDRLRHLFPDHGSAQRDL